MKYSFKNDYSEGAHPRIIEALASTNLVHFDQHNQNCVSLSVEENHLHLPLLVSRASLKA